MIQLKRGLITSEFSFLTMPCFLKYKPSANAIMRDDIIINDRALVLSDQLIETFETIIDPEIELDMYNLGLIYEVNLDENKHCKVLMTFTEASCSCAETMPLEIVDKLKKIDGIDSAEVEVTFSPAWKMTRISRYGRIFLGIPPR